VWLNLGLLGRFTMRNIIPQFIKSIRMVLFCGLVASVVCIGICAADSAINAASAADAPARLVIVNAVYGNFSDPA